jgi:hypothetical protein
MSELSEKVLFILKELEKSTKSQEQMIHEEAIINIIESANHRANKAEALAQKRLDDYNEEVRQFNEGFEAAKHGESEDSQPNYEMDYDQWRIGYAWQMYESIKARLAELEAERRWIPVEESLPDPDKEVDILWALDEDETFELHFGISKKYEDEQYLHTEDGDYDKTVYFWRYSSPILDFNKRK